VQIITLASLIAILKKIPVVRAKALTLETPITKIINYYAHDLIWPCIQLIIKISLLIENHHPSAIGAYSCFLQWKERVGLERAIAMKGFVSRDFSNKDFLDRVLFLISEQNSFKDSFLSLATLEQKTLVESAYQQEKVKKLSSIHSALGASQDPSLLKKLSTNNWFDITSEKMNALHLIEKKLISTLDGSHSLSKKTTLKNTQNHTR